MRVLLLLTLMLVGCQGNEPFGYVKTSGKVTYDDGSLIPGERVVVTFLSQNAPLDASTHPRPGIAEVNVKSGTFDCVTSHTYGDGIVPGKHKVTIRSIGGPAMATPAVPKEYTSAETTPLMIDSSDGPFVFTIPKPR